MSCHIQYQGKTFTEEEFIKYAYKNHLNLNDNQEFYQLSSEENSFYDSQAEGKTKEAKQTLDKIKALQKRVKFIEEGHKYIFENNQKMTSVSDFYKSQKGPKGEDDFYTFDENYSKAEYQNNIHWGNQLDVILRAVILDKSLDDAKNDVKIAFDKALKKGVGATMSNKAIEQSYNTFKQFKKQFPDSVMLSQVILFNEEKNVAGTVDLLLVHPDGTISIIDLKSSVDFSRFNYQPINRARAFKKDSYTAQLSAYKALAVSKDLEFDESKDLFVYLNELTINEDELTVESVKELGLVPLVSTKNIFDKLKSDAYFISDSVVPIEATTEFSLYVDEIKKLVKNKIEKAKKENKPQQEYVFERLLNNLNSADNLKAMSLFIDDTYNQFLSKEYYGLYDAIQKDILKIKANKYSPEESIGRLHYYQGIIQLYSPIIAKLNTFYKQHFFTDQGKLIPVEMEEGSPLDKLTKIVSVTQQLNSLVNNSLIPLQAEILASQASQTANTELEKEIKRRLERYNNFVRETKSKNLSPTSEEYKKRKKREEYLKEQYDIIARNTVVNKESIEKELKYGANKDIGLLDSLLNPTISSENSILSTFAKLLKSKIEDVRQELVVFSKKAVDKFEDYALKSGLNRNDVETFNQGLYEKVLLNEDTEALSFIQPLDITRYFNEKNKAFEKIEATAKDALQESEMKAKWYAENRVLPQEDIKIGNTIIYPGIERIKTKMKEKLKNNYADWESRNIFTSENGDVSYSVDFQMKYFIPNPKKYSSSKFEQLKNDETKWSYYKFLVESYFKAQDRLPEYSRRGFILPSIKKGSTNLEKAKSFLTSLKKDDIENTNIYGEEESSLKTIPILFTNYLSPAETSVDLISSIMLFEEASRRYDMRSEMAPIADTLLNVVQSTTPNKTNSQGYQILDKAATSLGIDSLAQYMKKHNGNNIAALLEAFIDIQIYGKKKEKSTTSFFGKEVDLGKAADALMGFQAFGQIGGNPLLSVANSLQANALATFEAITGQYFSKKDWLDAKIEYTKLLPDFTSDAAKPINSSLIGQLIDLYDPMQGHYLNEYGREVSYSGTKKNLNFKAWFFLQNAGEHEVQITTFIAKLKATKVKQNGKEISLYDAYELDKNGQIKLKEGINMPLMSKDIQFAIHAINKKLHGVYNDFDKPTIERFWWGRLLMMYRKFVYSGYKKRYKEVSVDQELGLITEGTYRTFFRVLTKDFNEMFKIGFGFGNTTNSDLTQMEIMNIRRTTLEFGSIILLAITTAILESLYDGADDDDKKPLSYPLYWSMRLQSELGFFINPADTARLFRSPSAGYSTIEKTIRLINQTTKPFEVYKRDTGYADKGDYKLPYVLLKLFGINGYNSDPEEAIKALQLSKM